MQPERILIVRLTAVGDVIHGTPVLCALRDRYPDAHIAWVVEGGAGDLLEGHRALNELIRVPRRWYRSPRAVLALRRRLRASAFDTTVDLQCLTKSALVAWLSGAQQRLGVDGADGRELSKWFNNVLTPVNEDHVIHHYLGILQPFGIKLGGANKDPVGFDSVRFDLEQRDEDANFAETALADCGLGGKSFALLNPGAGWPSKLWPADRYGELAQQLAADHGLSSLVVWGGQEEQLLAETIVQCSGGTAQMAPPTTLRQLAAICRRASLFVGSDTGPMHLAVAVDTPAVSLHGPSRAEWCGAYGPTSTTVQAYYQEGTATERRTADNAAMRAISVDDVMQACSRVLTRKQSRRSA